MFYKVENGQLIEAPERNLKVFIGNPTDEQYRMFGYTDKVIEDAKPEEQEGYYIYDYYEQIDGIIYHRYKLVEEVMPDEIPVEEPIMEMPTDIPQEAPTDTKTIPTKKKK